jgi:hypothetical protein
MKIIFSLKLLKILRLRDDFSVSIIVIISVVFLNIIINIFLKLLIKFLMKCQELFFLDYFFGIL